MWEGNVLLAFGLTVFAGLSTGVGSAIALFRKTTNTRFLSVSLGFSAGVMLYVSFTEILVKGREALVASSGPVAGSWLATASFFTGILVIALIDKLVPDTTNPHEVRHVEVMHEKHPSREDAKLARMGVMTALAVGIHNFPEGLATFTAALKDPKLGIAIAVAVAIHNIPEGIAVSVPVFFATRDRRKAFRLSFLSGLSEPAGALLGYLVLAPFFNDMVLGLLFAFVAGIMVFISLDELLPTAQEYGEPHLAIYGLVAGMAVMAVSLLVFI